MATGFLWGDRVLYHEGTMLFDDQGRQGLSAVLMMNPDGSGYFKKLNGRIDDIRGIIYSKKEFDIDEIRKGKVSSILIGREEILIEEIKGSWLNKIQIGEYANMWNIDMIEPV